MGGIFFYIPAIFLFFILTNHFLHKIKNLPPTPFPSLPLIGHLYLLKKPIYRTLTNISNQYGPVVFLRFGSRPVLVVSSPSAAEECLSKNDVVFANRPRLLISKCFGYNNTNLVWASYGDHWRDLRRISTVEVLSSQRLQKQSGIRLDEVRSLVRRLAERENDNLVVNMRVVFFDLTFNTMMRMIAGKRFYGDDVVDVDEAKRFREIQAESGRLSGVSILGDYIPLMGWLGFESKVEKEMMECNKKRDDFMQGLIDQYRETTVVIDDSFGHGRKKTMIQVLLELQESEPERYSDDTIKALMLVLLVAGTETSVNTMEWALSLLLNHPEALKKAQSEIDGKVGPDRFLDESDVAHLPYLRGIINETFRMYPPVPLMVPHESSEDCTVGGYFVPRGTMLFVNLWAIQNDPTIWAHPIKFDPERYERLESERYGFNLMPFGSGRRGCPGESLGLRVVGLELGSLIQCFEWEKPNEDLVDMTEGIAVSMPRANPLHVKCRPRPIMVNLLSQIKTDLAHNG